MTGLDIFALIVLIVLVAAVVAVFIALARWPGQIAANRGHPQVDAIRVAGWLGMLSLGIFWPIAMIWAFIRPVAAPIPLPERPAEPSDEEAAP